MTNNDIRQEITKTIAEAVQKGCPPWRCPWGNSSVPMKLPHNFLTGNKYKGINPLLMMMASNTHGFRSPYWGTARQWDTIGGIIKSRSTHVLGGNWGTNIIFYTTVQKEAKSPVPTEKERYMVLRWYSVFNVEQVEPPSVNAILAASEKNQKAIAKNVLGKGTRKMTIALAKRINQQVARTLESFCGVKAAFDAKTEYVAAEELLAVSGANFQYGGNKAFYMKPPDDYIQMPDRTSFDTPSTFYETALHELMHWAESRCSSRKDYAFSELVAEIGACFLAAEVGLPIQRSMLPRSESYVQHWLSHMGNDTRYIFEAATQSGRIADYVLNLRSNP